MQTLVARNAPGYYAKMLFQTLVFGVMGIYILFHYSGPAAWPGWACMVSFSMCAYTFVPRFFDARPCIVINDEGVFDRTLGIGVIPWGDINDAYSKSVFGKEFICLDLRNTVHWLMKLSTAQRAVATGNERFGFQPFNIYLTGTTLNKDIALATILKRCGRSEA